MPLRHSPKSCCSVDMCANEGASCIKATSSSYSCRPSAATAFTGSLLLTFREFHAYIAGQRVVYIVGVIGVPLRYSLQACSICGDVCCCSGYCVCVCVGSDVLVSELCRWHLDEFCEPIHSAHQHCWYSTFAAHHFCHADELVHVHRRLSVPAESRFVHESHLCRLYFRGMCAWQSYWLIYADIQSTRSTDNH